jgi:hypothetical protein
MHATLMQYPKEGDSEQANQCLCHPSQEEEQRGEAKERTNPLAYLGKTI